MTEERNGNRFYSIHQEDAQTKEDLGKDKVNMRIRNSADHLLYHEVKTEENDEEESLNYIYIYIHAGKSRLSSRGTILKINYKKFCLICFGCKWPSAGVNPTL
jgi:hypothetical protein